MAHKILLIACHVLALAPTGALLADESEAARALAKAGLVKSGRFWVCPREIELRRQVEALPALERQFLASRKEFQQTVAQYQTVRKNLTSARAALAALLERLMSSPAASLERIKLEGEAKKLADRIGQMQQQIDRRLDVLDEASAATRAAIALVNDRNALALCLLAVERDVPEVSDVYRDLVQRKDVVQAVRAVGEGGRLGPAENYASVLARDVKRLRPLVFGEGVPVYRRSGQFRLSLILDDRTAATFSYAGARGPTLVPASVAERLGLQGDRSAAEEVMVGDRAITARRIILPRLRLGKFVFQAVPALALPPEAEDLGGQISLASFGDYHGRLDEEKLWFRLHPPEQ